MSAQDDGTDANAVGPREGGLGVPLTAEALAIMGLNDPRRNAPGAVSEWAYVTSPTQHRASLAGSPQQINSAHYSPSEVRNIANYYQQHILAPTFLTSRYFFNRMTQDLLLLPKPKHVTQPS